MAMTGERVVSAPGRTRPRGFAPWAPRSESLELLIQIQAVLDEYRDFLPLSCRSIFYRLIGRFGFPKTEAAADRAYNVIGRARRAGLIPFESISDGWSERRSSGPR